MKDGLSVIGRTTGGLNQYVTLPDNAGVSLAIWKIIAGKYVLFQPENIGNNVPPRLLTRQPLGSL